MPESRVKERFGDPVSAAGIRGSRGELTRMSLLIRPLLALALAAGALAAGGSAMAACPAATPPEVPPEVCAQIPVRVPRCWVDTYRVLVTCEYPIPLS